MVYILDNLAAILVATGIALLIGVWAGRADRVSAPGVAGWLAIVAALFCLMAILAGALILAPAKASRWTMAISSACVIWAGFIGPVNVIGGVTRRRGVRAIMLEAGVWLVIIVAGAAAMTAIGLVAPPAPFRG